MKKLLILIIILALSVTTLAPTIRVQASVLEENSERISFEFIVDDHDYQKIKIVDNETGKVEYIESYYEDGEFVYVVTSGEEEHEIRSNEDEILITNQNTGETETIEREEIIYEEIVEDQSLIEATSNGQWITAYISYGSNSIEVATTSFIASLIAAIVGGPVTGVIVAIAGYYVSINATHLYWQKVVQVRTIDGRCEKRTIHRFFQYHDYTGYINSTVEVERIRCY